MELFILICGFVGAWLLVAGPINQAAIELSEEQVDREGFQTVSESVPRPQPVSRWWWLLPPVAYLLHRSRDNAYRAAVMDALSVEQRSQWLGFVNKASAWMTVAGGAALIALKETWELVEHLDGPLWSFVVAVFVLAALCLGSTVYRVGRTRRVVVGDAGGGRPARAGARGR